MLWAWMSALASADRWNKSRPRRTKDSGNSRCECSEFPHSNYTTGQETSRGALYIRRRLCD